MRLETGLECPEPGQDGNQRPASATVGNHALGLRVIAPWFRIGCKRNSIMKLMMNLLGLMVLLLGGSGCVIREQGGAYDGYYRGTGYGYHRYDYDHDRWYRDHYYHDYRY